MKMFQFSHPTPSPVPICQTIPYVYIFYQVYFQWNTFFKPIIEERTFLYKGTSCRYKLYIIYRYIVYRFRIYASIFIQRKYLNY